MRKDEIYKIEQALHYMTDCTLATVESMAMKKTKSKHEFERQISIAQSGIDFLNTFVSQDFGSRPGDVINKFNGNVEYYIDKNFPQT